MRLEPNDCAQCRRTLGYVAPGTLMLPTLCILCAADPETLKEWGHTVDKKEVKKTCLDYRFNLNRMDLT